jgi:hypothetical protein
LNAPHIFDEAMILGSDMGEFSCKNENFLHTSCNLPVSFPRQNSPESATETVKNCSIMKFQLSKTPFSGQHRAFLAVQTRKSSLKPTNPPRADPDTHPPETFDFAETQPQTQIFPPARENPDSIQQIPAQMEIPSISHSPGQNNPIQRISQAVSALLHSPKAANPPPTSNVAATDIPSNSPNVHVPTIPPPNQHIPHSDTYLTDGDENDVDSHGNPLQIPLDPLPTDDLTSSTRTDFTYPPVEDLTKTLLKYAKNANLRKLTYPSDLISRRRQFNLFIDNLRIVCNISPYTRQIFSHWPHQILYSHPFVGAALYNLIFTHVNEPCQRHIIDGPPDARTALITLRRHCAPLTPDHIDRTREAFISNKQGPQEVATSYLERLRLLNRDCFHAGITFTDSDLLKRAIRGGNDHRFV